jgi:hypothetical protein
MPPGYVRRRKEEDMSQELLNVAEEILRNSFTSCNCSPMVCDSTCTHGKLVLAVANAKSKEKVFVVWGETPSKDESSVCTYEFATPEEARAFELGIDESLGWGDAATFATEEDAQDYLEEVG